MANLNQKFNIPWKAELIIHSPSDLESVVRECGKDFVALDDRFCFWSPGKDKPNMVHFWSCCNLDWDQISESEKNACSELGIFRGIRNTYFDGLMLTSTGYVNLKFGDTKISNIKKWLQNPLQDECAICLEDCTKKTQTLVCPTCSIEHCIACQMQWAFGQNDNLQRIYQKKYELEVSCPNCRQTTWFDASYSYFFVLDDLDRFSAEEKKAILFIKRHDPNYKHKQRANQSNKARKIKKKFQIGQHVKLHSLKKKDWNGRQAVIIGNAVNRQFVRWPVQLKKGGERALIKEANLKLI